MINMFFLTIGKRRFTNWARHLEEPYESRGSRTVPWGAWGENPLAYSTNSFVLHNLLLQLLLPPQLLLAKGCSLKDITGKFPVIETIAILLINSNCLFLSEGLYRLSGFFYLPANYSPIILAGRLLLDSSKHCPFLLRRFQYFAGFYYSLKNHFTGWPRAGGWTIDCNTFIRPDWLCLCCFRTPPTAFIIWADKVSVPFTLSAHNFAIPLSILILLTPANLATRCLQTYPTYWPY